MNQKPFHLFLITGIIFLLISFFILKDNNVIDIHIHDTYFVIASEYLFGLLAILSLFFWLLYLVTNKMLFSKALMWAHVMITLSGFIIFASDLYLGTAFSNLKPRRYYDLSSSVSFGYFHQSSKVLSTALIVLLFGQLIFLINLITGLFKRPD